MAGLGSALDRITIPQAQRAPLVAVLRRIGFAASLVVFVAVVVRLGGDGFVDNATDQPIGFLDALYYASVTVTTTGYGDITGVSNGARLATIVLITPARILFLILVVGTTVEVLTNQSLEHLLTRRWRKRVVDHFVICGFGSTGQSAAADLVSRDVDPSNVVVVDRSSEPIERATELGFVAIHGDATQQAVLDQAAIERARAVILSPNRDDTAVLITLTAREMNPTLHIVAAGRERENLHLLKQAGADEVVDATAAVGRMLGLGTYAPGAVRILDDLLDAGDGLELVEVSPETTGGDAKAPAGSTVVAVIRDGVRLPPAQVAANAFEADDRLVVLRESPNT